MATGNKEVWCDMAVTTTDTAVQVSVELSPSDGVVIEGNSLGVTIRITALRPALIERVDVALIRKVNYTYGRGNVYGGVFPARERSTELLTAVSVPAGGSSDWEVASQFTATDPTLCVLRGAGVG